MIAQHEKVDPGFQIPGLDRPIITRADQSGTGGNERQTSDLVGVRSNDTNLPPRRNVPDNDLPVVAATCDEPPIRREDCAPNRV